MTTNTTYKTLVNGSIDYAFYTKRSHEIRSNEAHAFLRSVMKSIRSLFAADPKGKASRKPVAKRNPLQRGATRQVNQGWRPRAERRRGPFPADSLPFQRKG